MANASCSNGILIQLTNAIEGALVEEVRGRRRRETLYGMKKFLIAKDDITTYRPPPRGCNHEHRLHTKERSLKQKLQDPHMVQIERAIQRYVERHEPSYQEELNLRTVITEIRLFGQAGRSQVRLQPRGWVACRFDVVTDVRKILDKIPSNIPQNLDLGSKIEVGLSGLTWEMADVAQVPKTVSLGEGFDLPTHGYRFFLSVEDARGIGRPPPSSCGLLCSVVVEQGGRRQLARVCRIGGIIEILDEKGSKKLVAVTVAHGLSDYVLAATARRTVDGHKRRFQKKVTERPRVSDRPQVEGVPEEMFSNRSWTPITGFHAINWLGNVWSPTPQHSSSVSIGNLAHVTADADFALLDVPFSLQNTFSAGAGVQSIAGLAMDNELLSMAEVSQELNVIVGPDRVLSAALLSKTPFMFVRGRHFATRMIRLNNNEPLPHGTSGCWVVTGNKLCGVIVASNDREPIAYMISAEKLFSDIEKTIGRWPEVDPALPPTRAITSADIQEIQTAGPCLPASEGFGIAHSKHPPLEQTGLLGVPPRPPSPVGASSGTYERSGSFEDQLISSMVVSAGEGNDRRFLPQNVLLSLINGFSVLEYMRRSVHLKQHSLPVMVDYVLKSARKLFAILVLVEGCEILEDMYDGGLKDEDLPLVTDGAHFYRRGESSEMTPDFRLDSFNGLSRRKMGLFDTEQWALLAPRFNLDDKGNPLFYRLHRKVVLPWLTSDRVMEAGRSTIRRVRIHPAHFNFSKASSAQEFAVKQLRSMSEETFHMEISALMRLPRHTHLNTVLASYQWQDSNYLVFPWADGNLSDFWDSEMPRPSITTALVLWFLEQCAGLAEGLSIIHGTSKPSSNIWHGRHGDIKPQNILWYREEASQGGMGVLKISDFGETRFHHVSTEQRGETTNAAVTISYSAPEFETERAGPVSRFFDVWSLGCVFLEFAAWLLRGAEGVDDFRQARTRDTRQGMMMDTFYQMIPQDESSLRKTPDHTSLQAVVKPSVTECVVTLQHDLKSYPPISSTLNGFLALVLEKMLVVGRGRATSVEVQSSLQSLFEEIRYGPVERPIPRTSATRPRSQLVQKPSSSSKAQPKDPGGKYRALRMRPRKAASFDREVVSLVPSAHRQEKTSNPASAAAMEVLPWGKLEEEIEETVRETDAAGRIRGTWYRNTRRMVELRHAALHHGAKASDPSASKTVDPPDTSDLTSMSGVQLMAAERALLRQLMAIKEVQIERELQTTANTAMGEPSKSSSKYGESSKWISRRRKSLWKSSMRQFSPKDRDSLPDSLI